MVEKLLKVRVLIAGCLLLVAVVFVNGHTELPEEAGATQLETRCGWFDNPTPANISLFDRDAQWVIGVQGGHQVEGDWDWPEFGRGQWVVTNGTSYGYGCVCMQVRADKETHKVLEITSARARPLSACRRDQSLKRWRRMFK